MKILHGTWIPHQGDEFIQQGGFYLWVETDTFEKKQKNQPSHSHPRQLTQAELPNFLTNNLGITPPQIWQY